VNDVRNGNEERRSVEEVRASLERSTQDLRAALERLELGARAKLDIGKRITGHAPRVLIVGFFVGVLLGMATVRRRQLYVARCY
jgi:hypothetical protein